MPEGNARARERQRAWDALNRWCAERGSGALEVFRRVCAGLELDVGEACERLSALGHVEISWPLHRWAAAPSCLAELEAPPGRLLLTGAATEGLPVELDRQLADAALDAAVVGPFAQGGRGPSSFHVECDERDWPAIERATGLPIVVAPARRLARLLPCADLDRIGGAYVPDGRIASAPLDPETLRPAWGAPVGPGSVAVQRLGGRQAVWWARDSTGRGRILPSRSWGPYLLEATPDPLIRYDAAESVLGVRAAAPLPPLHARAACLCAGRVPGRAHAALDAAEDRYRAVPAGVADAIVASLSPGARQ